MLDLAERFLSHFRKEYPARSATPRDLTQIHDSLQELSNRVPSDQTAPGAGLLTNSNRLPAGHREQARQLCLAGADCSARNGATTDSNRLPG
jgi:hypothetical protein